MSASQLLTPRQRQVLALRADGKTRKEIASELGLTLKTVEYHFHGNQDEDGIYQRLGIYDVALLTQWALQQGLVVRLVVYANCR